MCADDPRERPHMSSVLLRYNDYLASLTRDDLCRLTVVDLIQSGNWPDHVAAAQARRAEQTPW